MAAWSAAGVARSQLRACGESLEYQARRVVAPDGVGVAVQDWLTSDASAGRDVLFIHGFSQSHGVWLKQLSSSLAQAHRLVTYDLRGHGDSDKPTDPVYYREASRWADELHGVINHTGLKRPVVVAWSYAGRVVLDYLSTFGDAALGGLVMVNATSKAEPALLGPAAPLLRQMGNSDPGISSEATRGLLRACVAAPLPEVEFDFIYRINMAVPSRIRANLSGRETQYEAALRAVHVPTLVVHGSRDPITLPSMSLYTAAQVRGARRIDYADLAHMPFWESPSRFNEDLGNFLRAL